MLGGNFFREDPLCLSKTFSDCHRLSRRVSLRGASDALRMAAAVRCVWVTGCPEGSLSGSLYVFSRWTSFGLLLTFSSAPSGLQAPGSQFSTCRAQGCLVAPRAVPVAVGVVERLLLEMLLPRPLLLLLPFPISSSLPVLYRWSAVGQVPLLMLPLPGPVWRCLFLQSLPRPLWRVTESLNCTRVSGACWALLSAVGLATVQG